MSIKLILIDSEFVLNILTILLQFQEDIKSFFKCEVIKVTTISTLASTQLKNNTESYNSKPTTKGDKLPTNSRKSSSNTTIYLVLIVIVVLVLVISIFCVGIWFAFKSNAHFKCLLYNFLKIIIFLKNFLLYIF